MPASPSLTQAKPPAQSAALVQGSLSRPAPASLHSREGPASVTVTRHAAPLGITGSVSESTETSGPASPGTPLPPLALVVPSLPVPKLPLSSAPPSPAP